MAAGSGNGNGRVALITGGMGGLGETIATKMVDAGYKVVVTYSPGNTKHKEWVAGMKAQRLRHPRRAVRRRRHRLVRRAPSATCRARWARSTSWSTTPASRAT